MEYLINLFILILYISHLFQPLDVGVFVFLKSVLIEKIDVVFQFDFSHISRAD